MGDSATGRMVRIRAADGHEFGCWLETAAGTRRGSIVVLQEIFGVTDQLKGVAARYAAQGYDVAVPALFDRKAPDTVVPFSDAPAGRDLMMSCDPEKVMEDIAATVAACAANGGKVAVIGFCWGGGLALRAAQDLDIAASVSFYGTRLPQYLGKPLKAAMQGHFGKSDDHTPPDVLAQVKAALPDFDMHLYDAGHAFANDQRPQVYVRDAAELAHERTAAFLARHMA